MIWNRFISFLGFLYPSLLVSKRLLKTFWVANNLYIIQLRKHIFRHTNLSWVTPSNPSPFLVLLNDDDDDDEINHFPSFPTSPSTNKKTPKNPSSRISRQVPHRCSLPRPMARLPGDTCLGSLPRPGRRTYRKAWLSHVALAIFPPSSHPGQSQISAFGQRPSI